MPDESRRIERIFSRSGLRGNLGMWAHLNVDTSGTTAGGWLVNTWSQGGAPYWQPRFHWFERQNNKIYRALLNIGTHGGNVNMVGEATDIEPEREAFIRENIAKWEEEWLAQGGKRL